MTGGVIVPVMVIPCALSEVSGPPVARMGPWEDIERGKGGLLLPCGRNLRSRIICIESVLGLGFFESLCL